METRTVAIACQGGGTHGAFTCGVLTALLEAMERELPGRSANQRRFDIVGLSGTSAGAMNAFMVWYGLMTAEGESERCANARRAVNRLWDTFQARRRGELAMNAFAQQYYRLQELGLSFKPPMPVHFNEWLLSALHQWSTVENAVAPGADLGEVRPEFYDFQPLLRACAPEFESVARRLGEVAANKERPRLLLGAVEIQTGIFEAFDSWRDPSTGGGISLEAVAASGTLPDIKRAQRVPGASTADGRPALYWDGLFSQNPPVREFVAGTSRQHTPDEIWVIRINPQKRDQEPLSLAMIEDRRNELAGNLSLNQELRFIETVNKWLAAGTGSGKAKGAMPAGFAKYKPIRIYVITMAKDKAELGTGSKFDRSPEFIDDMRRHGEERGAAFVPLWLADSPDLVPWPDGDALDRLDGR